MERFVERTLLYDFYGELLTIRQREIYENVVLLDYSISEVAQEMNVTRQSVHDMVRRCDKILSGYEERLHLVDKFLKIRAQAEKIRTLASASGQGEIASIAGEILGEL